jgi:hypothetical protein
MALKPGNTVISEKVIVLQLSSKFSVLCGNGYFNIISHVLLTDPYPKQMNAAHNFIPEFLKTYFNYNLTK